MSAFIPVMSAFERDGLTFWQRLSGSLRGWKRLVRQVERVVDDAGFRRLSAQLGALTRGQRRRIRSALDRLDDAAKVVGKPLQVGPAARRARGAIAPPHGRAVAVDAPGRGAFGSGACSNSAGTGGAGPSGASRSDAQSNGKAASHAMSSAGPNSAGAGGAGPSGASRSDARSKGTGASRAASSAGPNGAGAGGAGPSGAALSDAQSNGTGASHAMSSAGRGAGASSASSSGGGPGGAPAAGAVGGDLGGAEGPAAGAVMGASNGHGAASGRGFDCPTWPPTLAAGDLAAARDAGARRGCQAAGGLDDRRQCHDGNPSRSSGTGTDRPRHQGEHDEGTRPSPPAITPPVPAFGRIRLPDAFERVRDDMLHSRRPGTCRALAASLAIDKTTVWRWRRRIMATLHAAPRLPTRGSETRSGDAGALPAAGKRLRESRKGSRLWVDYRNNPLAAPVPHRPRWIDVDRGGELLPRPLWTFQHIVALGVDPAGRCHAAVMPAGPPADDGLRWRGACADSLATSRSTPPDPAAVAGPPRSRIGLPGAPADHADEPPAERLAAAFKQFLGPFRGPGAAHLDGYAAWFATRLDAWTSGRRHDRSTDVAITCVTGARASGA